MPILAYIKKKTFNSSQYEHENHGYGWWAIGKSSGIDRPYYGLYIGAGVISDVIPGEQQFDSAFGLSKVLITKKINLNNNLSFFNCFSLRKVEFIDDKTAAQIAIVMMVFFEIQKI